MKLFRRKTFNRIKKRLAHLYGHERADELSERLYMMFGRYGVFPHQGDRGTSDNPLWDEKDVVLITYGDMVLHEGEPPLATLKRFCEKRFSGAINLVHLLPFFPYSSDGGFSVIDYREVDPKLGSWQDVNKLGQSFDLMYDLVLNHCSAKSTWFKQYCHGVAPYKDYFISADPEDPRLALVTRPRPWPILTKVDTSRGPQYVWTTFSADQVDLNWKSSDVFFEFLDIFLGYISSGARIIRLDAVAFLWKKLGTNCIHLHETHEVVKLIRDILISVAPHVILLTETNVPHEENISYFGEGDEAHMVYNFALPPLLLHALLRNDSQALQRWARDLNELPEACLYFNFTASHDGIGVRALANRVPEGELDWLIDRVKERGGLVGYRAMPDGSKTPYELNITYLDALSDLDDHQRGLDRFLCSQAIMLALKGVPGVYFHSIVGGRNWVEGPPRLTGENRDINRKRWQESELDALLSNEESDQSYINGFYVSILRKRSENPAFHPDADQKILETPAHLFALVRTPVESPRKILCFFNLSAQPASLEKALVEKELGASPAYRNTLDRLTITWEEDDTISLKPYGFLWVQRAEYD